MIATVVMAVLVAGSATALAVVRTGDLTVRSTVADDGVRPAPEPARPSAQAWSWRCDDAVRGVRAAGVGVAVVQGDDEVLGLDGITGRPRWTFRRAGARLDALLVSHDRATVVAMYGSTASDVRLVTLLDATTGARRWEHSDTGGLHSPVVTDAVVATRERLPADGEHVRFRTTARALDTGARRWVYDSPGDCDVGVAYAAQARGVVPVTAQCPDRTTLTGLDHTTGGVESLDTDVILRRGYLVPAAGAVVVGVPSSGTTVLVGLRLLSAPTVCADCLG